MATFVVPVPRSSQRMASTLALSARPDFIASIPRQAAKIAQQATSAWVELTLINQQARPRIKASSAQPEAFVLRDPQLLSHALQAHITSCQGLLTRISVCYASKARGMISLDKLAASRADRMPLPIRERRHAHAMAISVLSLKVTVPAAASLDLYMWTLVGWRSPMTRLIRTASTLCFHAATGRVRCAPPTEVVTASRHLAYALMVRQVRAALLLAFVSAQLRQ